MAEVVAAGPHEEKKLRKDKSRGQSSMLAGKVMADEEMARRLHEELNAELSPAAAAVRRNRKAPTFFTPPMPGDHAALPESLPGVDAERAVASPRLAEASSPTSPFKAEGDRLEKAGSSAGKKAGAKARAPVYDSAENSPTARHRARQKREVKIAAPLVEESRGVRGRPEADESQSSRQGGRDTRLRTKDSAQDFPPSDANDKAHQDRSRIPELTVRVTRSSVAEASGGVEKSVVKAAVESEEIPTPKAAASGRLVSDSMNNRASSAGTSTRTSSQAASKGKAKQYPRIPKLPMCLHGNNWYRARKLGENKTKVNLDFPGVVGTSEIWLPKDSQRIWTGSYKGKDWKHLGGGAWEPKTREGSQPKKAGKGRKRRAATEVSESTSSGGDISETNYHLSDRAAGRSGADLATESQPSSSNADSDGLDAMDVGVEDGPEEGQVEGSLGDAAAEEDAGLEPRHKRQKAEPTADKASKEPGARESTDLLEGKSDNEKPGQHAEEDAPDPVIKRVDGSGKREVHTGLTLEARESKAGSTGVDKAVRGLTLDPPKTEVDHREKAGDEKDSQVKHRPAKGLSSGHRASTGIPEGRPSAEPSMALPHRSSGLEELVIAVAGAKGMGQSGSKPEAQPGMAAKSARNRKRAAARAARAAVEGEAHSPSETDNGKSSSNTPPESPAVKLPASSEDQKPPDSVELPAAAEQEGNAWRMRWNEKHMQRLKELEEEEKAAETQELPEDLPEPYPEQASERPMRAIRAPRLNAIDRLDGNGRGSRDLENGSPQTPVRRAGRGRGRWANHVRKGTAGRGAKSLAPNGLQDTPQAGRGGGRGRRGGRWGTRPSKPEVHNEDTCLLAFGSLVNALENRLSGVPTCYLFQDQPESCPSILQLSPDNFAGTIHRDLKSFRMPPPPVPLFRVVV